MDPAVTHEANAVKKKVDLAPMDGLRREIGAILHDVGAETSRANVISLLPNSESFYESIVGRLDLLAVSLSSEDSEALHEEVLPELREPEDGDGSSSTVKKPRGRRDSDSTIVDLEEDGQRRRNGTLKAPHPLLELIGKLRRAFDLDEGECLAFVDELDPEQVNGARFFFRSKATAAKARLSAWETKHASDLSEIQTVLGRAEFVEPEFFAEGKHLFPLDADIAVVVREKELSSLIAFSELSPLIGAVS